MERGYTIIAIGTIKIFAMAGEREKIVEMCNGLLDELEAEAAQPSVQRTADDDPQPGSLDYWAAVTSKNSGDDRRR